MGFSQFPPAPAAGGASVAAFAATISAKNTTFRHIQALEEGVYTITCNPTSTDVTAAFLDATSVLTTQITTNGTVSFLLSAPATSIFLTAKNNATVFPTTVAIAKTANPLTSSDIGNGILDTINASGTYNETGVLSVLAIGGGAFGLLGFTGGGDAKSGAGGAPGNVATGIAVTNTATTVTIGAKGLARNTVSGADTAQTNSSFGNLITTANTSTFLVRGTAGAISNGDGNPGNAGQTFPQFNTTGTNGGGGSGNGLNSNANARAGGGSGIGTGGAGGVATGQDGNNRTPNAAPGDGTGKGAGGGGGQHVGNQHENSALRFAGDGSDGVIYVLRGF